MITASELGGEQGRRAGPPFAALGKTRNEQGRSTGRQGAAQQAMPTPESPPADAPSAKDPPLPEDCPPRRIPPRQDIKAEPRREQVGGWVTPLAGPGPDPPPKLHAWIRRQRPTLTHAACRGSAMLDPRIVRDQRQGALADRKLRLEAGKRPDRDSVRWGAALGAACSTARSFGNRREGRSARDAHGRQGPEACSYRAAGAVRPWNDHTCRVFGPAGVKQQV